METATRKKPGAPREDGRVILHVWVNPEVRRGVHMLARLVDGEANDVLRAMVRDEMRRQKLPVPAGLARDN